MNCFEIKGSVNTAVCYAKVVEEGAIEQIRRMCDYPMTEGSQIRIMPDVHLGKGCTIGTTMTIIDKVVPNVVGVDIGCGMLTTTLGEIDIDLAKLDMVVHGIPSGRDIWNRNQEYYDLTRLKCYRDLKEVRRLTKAVGTLGGGNHFIEIDEGEDGTKYLVIHSGSRNLGKQVAEHYQRIAISLDKGYAELYRQKKELIETYKAQGRRTEIQGALKQLQRSFKASTPTTPEDLCCLFGEFMEDYLHDVELCQEFARKNREVMARIILEEMGLTAVDQFHTIHNYIDTNEMILRKGAIAAYKGQKVLIPINMRDGSIIAIGKGNPDWNYSAPHGAGRVMSRKQAANELSLEEFKREMEGIYSTTICDDTLDEAPMVYKSLGDIIDVIEESVDVVEVIKPIYNFKAKE